MIKYVLYLFSFGTAMVSALFFFNCEINNRYNKQLLVSSSGSALWLWHSDDREVLLTEKSLCDRGATQWNGQDPSNTIAN